MSTIRAAERILVFEAGRVVESGDHRELMTRGGVYARLHGGPGLSPGGWQDA